MDIKYEERNEISSNFIFGQNERSHQVGTECRTNQPICSAPPVLMTFLGRLEISLFRKLIVYLLVLFLSGNYFH